MIGRAAFSLSLSFLIFCCFLVIITRGSTENKTPLEPLLIRLPLFIKINLKLIRKKLLQICETLIITIDFYSGIHFERETKSISIESKSLKLIPYSFFSLSLWFFWFLSKRESLANTNNQIMNRKKKYEIISKTARWWLPKRIILGNDNSINKIKTLKIGISFWSKFFITLYNSSDSFRWWWRRWWRWRTLS